MTDFAAAPRFTNNYHIRTELLTKAFKIKLLKVFFWHLQFAECARIHGPRVTVCLGEEH